MLLYSIFIYNIHCLWGLLQLVSTSLSILMVEGTQHKQQQESLKRLVDNLKEGVQELWGRMYKMNDKLHSLIAHWNLQINCDWKIVHKQDQWYNRMGALEASG